MKLLLRIFSFLFHLPLALFVCAVGAFALLQGVYNLNIDFLPWTGKTLTWVLFGGGFFGLLSLYRAMLGKTRFLFGLYALGVFVLAFNGAFLSAHRYLSANDFQWAAGFVVAAFAALIGALAHMRG